MHKIILAIGNLKAGPEKLLFDKFYKRLTSKLEVLELSIGKSKEQEGEALIQHIKSSDYVIALDERGKNLDTVSFYNHLQTVIVKRLVFVIGGANGLSDAMRARSDMLLQFGSMTWPHMLARVMLVEQLYRCQQIYSNHPYHK